MQKLITIGNLSRSLNLVDPKNKQPLNYILRYWEKEFKQIKPKIINNRRYYTSNQVKIIKLIHFLLKNKGLTIKGVKNILNSKINNLDDYDFHSLKADYNKKNIIDQSNKILNKIKKIKS